MAAMRSLCGPLELAMAYDGKLELLVDVLYKTNNYSHYYYYYNYHNNYYYYNYYNYCNYYYNYYYYSPCLKKCTNFETA